MVCGITNAVRLCRRRQRRDENQTNNKCESCETFLHEDSPVLARHLQSIERADTANGAADGIGVRSGLHLQHLFKPTGLRNLVVVHHGDEIARMFFENARNQRVADIRDAASGFYDDIQRPAIAARTDCFASLHGIAVFGIVVGDENGNLGVRVQLFERAQQPLQAFGPAKTRNCDDHITHGAPATCVLA